MPPIFGEPSAAIEPSERSFDEPTPCDEDESLGVDFGFNVRLRAIPNFYSV